VFNDSYINYSFVSIFIGSNSGIDYSSNASVSSVVGGVTIECPKYTSNTLPPSYEEAMSSTGIQPRDTETVDQDSIVLHSIGCRTNDSNRTETDRT